MPSKNYGPGPARRRTEPGSIGPDPAEMTAQECRDTAVDLYRLAQDAYRRASYAEADWQMVLATFFAALGPANAAAFPDSVAS